MADIEADKPPDGGTPSPTPRAPRSVETGSPETVSSDRDELRKLQEALRELQGSYDASLLKAQELRDHHASLQRGIQGTSERIESLDAKLQEQEVAHTRALASAEEKHQKALTERDVALAEAASKKKAADDMAQINYDKGAVLEMLSDKVADLEVKLLEKDEYSHRALERAYDENADTVSKWRGYYDELVEELAEAQEGLRKATKSNQEVAAGVFKELTVESEKLQTWNACLKTRDFKLSQLEKTIASGSDAASKLDRIAAREAAAKESKSRDSFITKLIEILMEGDFDDKGVKRFKDWYADHPERNPVGFPRPPGEPCYTEEQARAIYDEGRVMGYYEHEVCDDLKAVCLHKLEDKVKDFEKRIGFTRDEGHRLNPSRLGKDLGTLLVGAWYAKHGGKSVQDSRVLKSVPIPDPHLRLCPKDKRGSRFWNAFEEAGGKLLE